MVNGELTQFSLVSIGLVEFIVKNRDIIATAKNTTLREEAISGSKTSRIKS